MIRLKIGLVVLGFLSGLAAASVARADSHFCEEIRESTTAIARARDSGTSEDQVYAMNARYFRTAQGAQERGGMHELLDDLTHSLYTEPKLVAESPERTGAMFYAVCQKRGY